MIGFVRSNYPYNSSSGQHTYPYIKYATYCSNDHFVVLEDGITRGNIGTYTATSALEVQAHANGQVKYAIDGIVGYTSTVTNSETLYVGASMYTVASPTVTEIELVPL